MARKSLKANLTKPDIGKAAQVAKELTAGGKKSSAPPGSTDAPEYGVHPNKGTKSNTGSSYV
jgi:hypothetical protein